MLCAAGSCHWWRALFIYVRFVCSWQLSLVARSVYLRDLCAAGSCHWWRTLFIYVRVVCSWQLSLVAHSVYLRACCVQLAAVTRGALCVFSIYVRVVCSWQLSMVARSVYLRTCCVQLAAVTGGVLCLFTFVLCAAGSCHWWRALFIYVRVVCSWQLSLVGTERSENSEILRQLESRLFLKLPSHQVHIKARTPRTENMTICRLYVLLNRYRTIMIDNLY